VLGALACIRAGPAFAQGNVGITITVRVVMQPQIDGLSATSGPCGSQVWISGHSFGFTRDTSTVVFGPANTEAAEYLAWSNTAILCRVPAGLAVGANDVRVVVGGTPSNAVPFDVTDPAELCVDDSNSTGTENGTARWPFNTIAEAVAASSDGDAIKVAAGTYRETVGLYGTTLYVHGGYPGGADYAAGAGDFDDASRSLDRTANATALDGEGVRRCAIFDGCPGGELSGFIVRNGSTAGDGGGIQCVGSSPTIQACTIRDSAAGEDGGGIACEGSSPTIADCIIRSNTAGGSGGGLACEGGAGELARCEIYGNQAADGGGAWFYDSDAAVRNCVVTGNAATQAAGIACAGDGGPALLNDTVADNDGGGVLCRDAATPAVKHCILWGNMPVADPQLACADAATALVSYSNIQGGLDAGCVDGGENQGEDPRFVAPGAWGGGAWTQGDYRLASEAGHWTPAGWVADPLTSPCIDAGDPADGVGLEPAPNGACVNLGAYGGTAQASKSPAVAVHVITPDPTAAETLAGEPADTGLFRIRRIGRAGALTVNFLRAGTAAFGPGGDYTNSVGGVPLGGTSVVIPDGANDVDVLVEPLDDAAPEGTESVALVLVAGGGYRLDPEAGKAIAWIALQDNDTAVSIAATDPDAAETGDQGAFRIQRLDGGGGDITVLFALEGSASPKKDYLLRANGEVFSGTSLVLPAAPGFVDVEVLPVNDTAAEGPETVTVVLLPTAAYGLGPDPAGHAATVTIADDEPVVGVQVLDPDAAEPNAPGIFRFTRTGGGPEPVAVKFKPTGTAKAKKDYILRANGVDIKSSVEIPAAPGFLDVWVVPVDDAVPEPDETVVIALAKPKGFTIDPERQGGTVTIADDEPTFSIAATDPDAAEPANDGTFRITRTGGGAPNMLIPFDVTGSAARGVDYTLWANGAPFLDDAINVPANPGYVDIEVRVQDDALGEGAENIAIALEPGKEYTLDPDPAKRTAEVAIADDEAVVAIVATDPDAAEPADGGAFRITRTGGGAGDLVVSFARRGTATSGTDYTLAVGRAALPGDSIPVPAAPGFVDVELAVLDDALPDGDETATLAILPGPGYSPDPAQGAATVTIDDDEPVVSVVATDPNAAEAADNAAFRITRANGGPPVLNVRFAMGGSASLGKDYVLRANGAEIKGSVDVPAAPGFVDVQVAVLDDTSVEDPETAVLTLQPGTGYGIALPGNAATVNIADDEPTVTIAAVVPVAREPGTNGAFRLTRTGGGIPLLPIKFKPRGTAKAKKDYILRANGVDTKSSVEIPRAPGFVDVLVVPVDDTEGEPDETVTITLSKPKGFRLDPDPATQTATVTIADNEPTISIEALDPAASEPAAPGVFRVSRTAVGPANVTIEFSLDGTAEPGAPDEEGSDYLLLVAGTRLVGSLLNVPAVPGYVDIVVVPLDDKEREPAESVVISLDRGTGYGLDPDPAKSAAAILIADDDGAAAAGQAVGGVVAGALGAGEAGDDELAILVVPSRGPAPLEVAAMALGVDETARCEWDFGDGTTATGLSVTHTYCPAGTFTITLKARGQTATARVIVEPAPD